MTKGDSFSGRAAIVACLSVCVCIAVLASGYGIARKSWSRRQAAHSLSDKAKALEQTGNEYIAGDVGAWDIAEAFCAENPVYLYDASGKLLRRNTEAALPEDANALLERALEGEYAEDTFRENGEWAYIALPLSGGAILAGARARGGMDSSFWIVLAIGAALSAIAGYIAWKKLIPSSLKPIQELRNVAARIAGGDFDVRADRNAPGELGELAEAVNNVAYQMSRTLYSLILERNRLKRMIDGLSEGIIAVNAKGHITHQNAELRKMFPENHAEFGMDARMRVIPDKTIWEDFDAVVRKGGSVTRNIEIREMVVRMAITPIVDEMGTTMGAVGLFSDITQQERLERTRREYVANVSHELRTPLTAMRALVEPLKDGMVKTEEARMRYYDIILRETMRLSRLINDQLELSRLQSGTVSIQKSNMPIDDLVMDVCDRYCSIAKDHQLSFSLNTDFSECPRVYSNPDRLEQMLVILLDNAIKYTPEGGSIAVSATWDEEKVTMCVSDTGEGISAEDLPYIFDRFYKVDKAHSGKGSGLGLSIAKELLSRMGEEIWATSERGKGSRFYFTIHRAKEGK